MAGELKITIQIDTIIPLSQNGTSQPISEQSNCHESILSKWALVIFGHRSFDLQMISKCCEMKLQLTQEQRLKKKKSLRRRKEITARENRIRREKKGNLGRKIGFIHTLENRSYFKADHLWVQFQL